MSRRKSRHEKGIARVMVPVRGFALSPPRDLVECLQVSSMDVKTIADEILKESERTDQRPSPTEEMGEFTAAWLSTGASIATDAWRAKTRMLDPATGEPKEEMKRVYRYISSIFEDLKHVGVEITDPTGRAYDVGMAVKVISSEPTEGLQSEAIVQTIKPSIRWKGRLIQMAEVIVGTPMKSDAPKEGDGEQNND